MDKAGVRQVPEVSEERGKMEKTGCEIICGGIDDDDVDNVDFLVVMHFSPDISVPQTFCF